MGSVQSDRPCIQPASTERATPELQATDDTAPDPHAALDARLPREMAAPRRRRRHTALWSAAGLAVVLGLFIAILATRPTAVGVSVRSPLLGKPAPDASGVTIDGAHTALSDLRGRWVILNVFATWCVPCRAEHPDLVAFAAEHQAAGDVSLFGLVYADTPDAVRQYRTQNGGSWPMLEDPDGRTALNFGVSGVPESFVISPDGVVVAKYVGGVRLAQLDRVIADLKARPQ